MSEALYRLEFRALSRSQAGGGPTAKAAYRSGAELEDAAGQKHYYTRKGRQAVRGSEMILPPDAPAWANDPGEFWRRVDGAEKRADARWGRELIISLPRELPPDAQLDALRSFGREQLLRRGMAGQLSIHDYGDPVSHGKRPEEHATIRAEIDAGRVPLYSRRDIDKLRAAGDPRAWQDHAVLERGGALRRYQPHAHIMLADRPMDPSTDTGFASKKDRGWNDKQLVADFRSAWERDANAALERAGLEARLDRRSRRERGDQVPPEPKIGHSPSASRRAEYLAAREIRRLNRERRQIDRALEQMKMKRGIQMNPEPKTGHNPSPSARQLDKEKQKLDRQVAQLLRPWSEAVGQPPAWANPAALQKAFGPEHNIQWGKWHGDGPDRCLSIGLRSGGRLDDYGGRIELSGKDLSAEAQAMAAVASAKGWTDVNLHGEAEAQMAMAVAYARRGIRLDDADPAAHQAWAQERERIAQAQQQAPQQRSALDVLKAEAQASRPRFRPGSTPGAQQQQQAVNTPTPMPTPGMR